MSLTFSFVIAAYNELWELEGTVADLRRMNREPHEIIVVDDHSDPWMGRTVEQRLSNFGVKVIRPKQRLGPAGAKALGASIATEDVIVLCDGHLRIPPYALDRMAEAQTLYPNAVMCPACQGFESASAFVGCGAEFNRNSVYPDAIWRGRGTVNTIDETPAVMGGCYIVPRHVWHELAGYNPLLRGWGMEEMDLSLRAWQHGFEVRRINDLVIGHDFERTVQVGGRTHPWCVEFNVFAVLATVFAQDTFEERFEPVLREWFSKPAYQAYLKAKPSIEDLRTLNRASILLDDAALCERIGWPLPSIEQQRMTLERMQRARSEQVFKKGRPRPDMDPSHLQRLLDALPPNGRMLEYGSGGSTLWLRERLKPTQELVSIEHSEWWQEMVNSTYRDIEIESGPLVQCPYVDVSDLGDFDVVLIDGLLRLQCAKFVLNSPRVKPGALIALHDANFKVYRRVRQYLLENLKDTVEASTTQHCPHGTTLFGKKA